MHWGTVNPRRSPTVGAIVCLGSLAAGVGRALAARTAASQLDAHITGVDRPR